MTRLSLIICTLLVIVIATVDLHSRSLNTSILYLLPLLLGTKLPGPRSFWVLAIGLIALTFIGYFLGPHRTSSSHFISFRLVNRMLVALSIIVTAARISAVVGPHPGTSRSLTGEESENETAIYDLLITAGMLTSIFVADLMTPAQYNLPILYAVPLTVVAVLGRPRLLWILFVLSISCTVVGFFYPPSTLPPSTAQSLIQNRVVACVMQLGIVVLGQRRFFCRHVWTVDASPVSPAPKGEVPWICSFCALRMTLSRNDVPVRPEQ